MYARTQSNFEAQKFLSSLELICTHVRTNLIGILCWTEPNFDIWRDLYACTHVRNPISMPQHLNNSIKQFVRMYAAQFDWNSLLNWARFRDLKRFVRMYARTQSNIEA